LSAALTALRSQLLVPLRQPPAVIPSVDERERQEANVRKV
jgi:hypothetical protein